LEIVLYGRSAELAEVDRLIARAHAGRSAVLIVLGEAGSGKSALLERTADAAKDMRILRCTGVESEAELPFAALHQLLRRALDRLGALPDPQVGALRAAFGLAEAPGVDRFLAGLATLTLLAEVAGDGPLLCLVDDAQWLDRASAETLLFAGRRLDAEGVVLIMAARDDPAFAPAGLPTLRLGGLDPEAAAALLDDRAPGLPPEARGRLIRETGGNPLALIELAASGPGGLAPGGSRVLDAFGARAERLPRPARLALLVVAAEDTGELGVVLAAAERLGVRLTDLEPAERAGLLRFTGDTVTFRHPLIRSAVYGRSSVLDRLAVHRALADTLDSEPTADRRAWHLAAAATGFDETAATALEGAAARAGLRGGYAASAAAHERAARLTADPLVRGQRLAAAAVRARDSGQFSHAAALAEEASALAADPDTAAMLAWVRGRVEYERGTPARASELVQQGAETIREFEPEQAAEMLMEAVRMAYFADRAPSVAGTVALIDGLVLPVNHPLRPVLAATSIVGRMLAGDRDIPPLAPVVRAIRPDLVPAAVGLPSHIAFLYLMVGDSEEALALTDRMLAEARARGLIGGLTHLLFNNAQAALALGLLQVALRAGLEGVRIAEDTGQEQSSTNLRSIVARVCALTGDEERCVACAEDAMRRGAEHHGSGGAVAALALAVCDLGYGRYAAALARLEALPEHLRRHLGFTLLAPPEWIEAAARSGERDRAVQLLHSYESWARHQDRPIVAATLHRCRALVSPDERAEDQFRAALRLHQDTDRPLARARTELLYGEWLRRMRRRSESRDPLRAALRTFEEVGARSWADRARAELRATGETVAAAARADVLSRLTPQELQVARLAAAGLSNRDIGAQLFLSPRTVGYHLYKAFPKLGIAGRHQLAGLDLP
jgi:DNA-binding CsgD family transcriptional regulator